jgi:hypothetical protein
MPTFNRSCKFPENFDSRNEAEVDSGLDERATTVYDCNIKPPWSFGVHSAYLILQYLLRIYPVFNYSVWRT